MQFKERRGDERLLEKIARLIPGYGGYKEKELRREADKLQRTYIAKKLSEAKSSLESTNGKMTDKLFMDALGLSDRLLRRMEKMADKVRFASYGYGGFFDMVKVKEEELDKLYGFDASLLEDVDKIKAKVGELGASLDTQARAKQKLEELESLVGEIDRKIASRDDLIRGIR